MANQITPNIWIGNSQDAHKLPDGVTAVLNCAFDLKNVQDWRDGIHLAHCGLVDGPGNPLSSYYSAVLQLMTLLQMGRNVLVHCHAGQSRSVAVVLMYLNAKDNKGWDHWRSHLRTLREFPDTTPHEAHRAAFGVMDWDWLRRMV